MCVEREGIGKTIEKNGEATIQARQTGGRRTEGGRCNQARTVKAEGGREGTRKRHKEEKGAACKVGKEKWGGRARDEDDEGEEEGASPLLRPSPDRPR